MTVDSVLFLHAGATLAMTGLIWFVQVVHYPLYEYVGRRSFARYQDCHVRKTTRVVAPLMLVELTTALWMLVQPPARIAVPLLWLNVSLVAVVWMSTVLIQVPLHGMLKGRFDRTAHRRLVATNWIRTVAWSIRGALVLAFLRLA